MDGVHSAVRTLEQVRVSKLLTVRGLASAAGCSPNTIQQVEHGQRVPRLTTIRHLSATLGVAPMEIAEFRRVLLAEERHGRGPT